MTRCSNDAMMMLVMRVAMMMTDEGGNDADDGDNGCHDSEDGGPDGDDSG